MVKIPKQLQNPDFRFVLLGKWNNWAKYENIKGRLKLVETREFPGHKYEELDKEKVWKPLGKAPYERAWQTKGYKYDDPKLLKHQANFGVIGGYGNLIILDKDDPKLDIDLDTFTIETGSGGKHYYLISPYKENHVFVDELGELRAYNYQVVGPSSLHPCGKPYKIIKDVPIKHISQEDLLKIIKPYLRKENVSREQITEFKGKDTSRSGQEMKEIIKLILKGYSRKTIWSRMMFYAKWSSAPEQYREKTFQKAMMYVQKIYDDKEEKSLEEVELEVHSDKDLISYKPKAQKWLIKNQIPEGEIGVLAGKRGDRKTFTALNQAISLASGQECFGDEVPKKKKVVFVTEEDGVDTIATRIQALKKARGLEKKPLDIKYMCFNGLKFDKDDGKLKRFERLLKEFKPDLIIVDALQRCVTFEVDKDNRAISELFTERTRPLQKKYGGTWLFISHLRKSQNNQKVIDPLDEIRGGSEIVNYCRFVLMCQSPRYQTKTDDGSDLIIFKVLKMSNSQIPEAKVISFTDVDGGIKVAYEGIPEDVLSGEVQCAHAIKDWLINNTLAEFKTKDVNEASEEIGAKKTLISYGLKVLMKEGFLKKIKRGTWQVVGKKLGQTKLSGPVGIDFSKSEIEEELKDE